MSDAADDAQDYETNRRASALADAAPKPGPAPLIIDGVPCCAECEEPIPDARLKALPGIGLCMACAEELEAER